ncbi:MAG: 16S rRNA (uracil(1498)-N(3))-methyltransferase [Campylobacterales bacterium]|nr:16S rRNA (uracil(1498)-N(3))-methyltransferase [Campylobacterales bacterium]
MQYIYHENAAQSSLILNGDMHRYIFKVRRHKLGEIIALRDFKSEDIYLHKIVAIDKKEACLELQNTQIMPIYAKKELHIGWCIVEPKNIEKVLPILNEAGVSKVTFIQCKRSQQNFKLDLERLERILLNSSQQCGRSRMMEFGEIGSLQEFITLYPQSYILNFSQNNIEEHKESIDTIVIGCEGGFMSDEIALFDMQKVVGFDTPLILKSESAVCAVAFKILL